jgi:hypothetical protein
MPHVGKVMNELEYLRIVARRCRELSAQCFHLEIARSLCSLADELSARSAELSEHQTAHNSIPWRTIWRPAFDHVRKLTVKFVRTPTGIIRKRFAGSHHAEKRNSQPSARCGI